MKKARILSRIAIPVIVALIAVVAFSVAGNVFAADAGEAVLTETTLSPVDVIEQPRLQIESIAEAMPSTTYIRNNETIETELKTVETRNDEGTGAVSQNTVDAKFTVIPSIIIVVNTDDEIIEFWNNTQPEDELFCLKVKSIDGETSAHPLTPEIFTGFKDLFDSLDRTEQGNIFAD